MKYLLFILVSLSLVCCNSQKKSSSTLYSDKYEADKDQTWIMIFPYGQIYVPGKWTRKEYISNTRQYFYANADSVQFGVALNPIDKFEFYKKEMTPYEFVKAYYDWDASFLKQQTGGELALIQENKDKNYIIWSLKKAPKIYSYFLFGIKNKVAYNLYISTDKWEEAKVFPLLETIYNQQ